MIKLKKLSKRSAWLSLVALLLIVVGVVLVLSNKPNKGSGTIPTLSVAETSTKSSADGQQPNPNSAKSSSASPTNSNLPLVAPFGSFVSNHRPNLGGSPAPSREQSVCNTTPGANCYIQFTKNGVTKTLASQTTDSGGVASWSWDINQAGLTTGSWQITAVANLNGQTKTVTDSLTLEVQP